MFKAEFEEKIVAGLDSRSEDHGLRPAMEVWPEEDDFARWVSFHEDKVRAVICATPEFKDAPFCGRGFH